MTWRNYKARIYMLISRLVKAMAMIFWLLESLSHPQPAAEEGHISCIWGRQKFWHCLSTSPTSSTPAMPMLSCRSYAAVKCHLRPIIRLVYQACLAGNTKASLTTFSSKPSQPAKTRTFWSTLPVAMTHLIFPPVSSFLLVFPLTRPLVSPLVFP